MISSSFRMQWRAIWMVAEMSFRQLVMDAFVIFMVLVQPLLIALLALWMLPGQDYAMYVVVGSGMTGLWSSLLFMGGNSINIERWSGTLETLVGVPTSLSVIVFGKNLANVLQSLASMIVAYLLAALIFGYDLQIQQPLMFGVSLALTVIAFMSFGLIIAPIFVMNPSVQAWQNAMEFPVYILCGFLFPIAMLPVEEDDLEIEQEKPEELKPEDEGESDSGSVVEATVVPPISSSTPEVDPEDVSLEGVVSSIENDLIVINGIVMDIEFAEVDGSPSVGSFANLEGYYDASGVFIVVKIEFQSVGSGGGVNDNTVDGDNSNNTGDDSNSNDNNVNDDNSNDDNSNNDNGNGD